VECVLFRLYVSPAFYPGSAKNRLTLRHSGVSEMLAKTLSRSAPPNRNREWEWEWEWELRVFQRAASSHAIFSTNAI
jgi:hypothetical protein